MKLVFKELPSTLLYRLLQTHAKKGVFSPSWYWMRTLMGKVPSCRPHSGGRVGPAASCWAFPTIPCCCGKKQRGLRQEPSSQDLRWKEGRKHSEKRAVQSSFAMRLPAATCPLYRPINRGRGRKPAASSSACALSKAKFQGLRGQSLLGRCQLSAHTIIFMPEAKVVKKQGPGLCMGICLRNAPLLWHLFSFQGLGNVPLKAISNLHAKH